MGENLNPCPSCARHIRAGETACPFCNVTLPEGFGAVAKGGSLAAPLSRAAILFVGATAAAGCSTTSNPVPLYGVPPIDSSVDGNMQALYGPAPVDAGDEDAAGPLPAYGPAPVDSGSG